MKHNNISREYLILNSYITKNIFKKIDALYAIPTRDRMNKIVDLFKEPGTDVTVLSDTNVAKKMPVFVPLSEELEVDLNLVFQAYLKGSSSISYEITDRSIYFVTDIHQIVTPGTYIKITNKTTDTEILNLLHEAQSDVINIIKEKLNGTTKIKRKYPINDDTHKKITLAVLVEIYRLGHLTEVEIKDLQGNRKRYDYINIAFENIGVRYKLPKTKIKEIYRTVSYRYGLPTKKTYNQIKNILKIGRFFE